jgi:hypothetical protein
MATYHDARLVLELSRWAQEWGFHEANRWVWSSRFPADYAAFQSDCPAESEGYSAVHKVLGFYENVGLFLEHGVVDGPFLFDWLDAVSVWDRVRPVALGLRREANIPALWRSFERLAERQRVHLRLIEEGASDGDARANQPEHQTRSLVAPERALAGG